MAECVLSIFNFNSTFTDMFATLKILQHLAFVSFNLNISKNHI